MSEARGGSFSLAVAGVFDSEEAAMAKVKTVARVIATAALVAGWLMLAVVAS